MSIPNLFTALRIVLIPVFGWLWWSGRHAEALWVFAIAGMTDLVDGFLARYLDQRTRLGALLDPAADKLMLLVSFLVAASLGAVPWWLAALVIGRDVILALGAAVLALALRDRYGPSEWRPSRVGKYATFFQLTTIGIALLSRAARWGALEPWVQALVLVTGALTLVSGLQYVARALAATLGPTSRARRAA
jgi:cardiolipin synthase